jgi:hypothetical protein
MLNAWRYSTVTVLYKGKGKQDGADVYRGIALECAPFKVLTRVILNLISGRIRNAIPDEQFGFIPGKSTLQAVGQLLSEVRKKSQQAERLLVWAVHGLRKGF